MWIKLLTVKKIEIAGTHKTYHPGDWVDVGKQLAMRWINAGSATVVDYNAIMNLKGVGVTLQTGGKVSGLLASYKGIEVKTSLPDNPLPYDHNVIVSKGVKLRPGLLPVGIGLLVNWQIAVPVIGYSDRELALYTGTAKDKEYTKERVLDLRVPVYDTRLIFVKRCPDTQRLFKAWERERKTITDERLAFLVALWEVKPLICALPVSWKGKR